MVVGKASGWSDWQSYSLDVSSINMLLSVIPSTPTSIPEYQNKELTLRDPSLPLCFIGSSFVWETQQILLPQYLSFSSPGYKFIPFSSLHVVGI